MTHEEFQKHLSGKQVAIMADFNKIITRHGLKAIVTGFRLHVPELVATPIPASFVPQAGCRKAPCPDGEVLRPVSRPTPDGGFSTEMCCVPED